MALVEVEPDSETGLVAAARLLTAYDREACGPNEPPRTPAAVADWLDPPAGRERRIVLAGTGPDFAGVATLQLRRGAGNDHLAWVPELFVAPAERRRHHGLDLIEHLAAVARTDGRAFLVLHHLATPGEGTRFGDHIGARYAMTIEQQRVATADISRALLESWEHRASERAGDYDIVTWDDVCPPEHLERFAAAQQIMNDAPHPESTNDWIVSTDEIRAIEATHAHTGTAHWIVVARHRPTGDFAGYTELTFDRHQPGLAHQGDTGVAAVHRTRGLGRWIKAINLRRLLDARTRVTHVETWNAGANEPMIAINDELGFRRVAEWQDRELWLD